MIQIHSSLLRVQIRQAEFGRAVAQMWSKGKREVEYVGVLRKDQKNIRGGIAKVIYNA